MWFNPHVINTHIFKELLFTTKIMKNFRFSKSFCARGETRTRTSSRTTDFESVGSTIPPLGHRWEQKDFRSHLPEVSQWWHSPPPGCVTKKLHLYYISFLSRHFERVCYRDTHLGFPYNIRASTDFRSHCWSEIRRIPIDFIPSTLQALENLFNIICTFPSQTQPVYRFLCDAYEYPTLLLLFINELY